MYKSDLSCRKKYVDCLSQVFGLRPEMGFHARCKSQAHVPMWIYNDLDWSIWYPSRTYRFWSSTAKTGTQAHRGPSVCIHMTVGKNGHGYTMILDDISLSNIKQCKMFQEQRILCNCMKEIAKELPSATHCRRNTLLSTRMAIKTSNDSTGRWF